ncbi:hypothetical protein [Rhodopila sp.]|uniref:hypothetical protein n=1 Tax=Rhodopila sp. TaxID=2480087 RepID=UPI003D13F287
MTSFKTHQQEDEGYLAAANGQKISDNPYPPGTIRHAEWRAGWNHKQAELRGLDNEGYCAALERGLDENPYPRGTIRYEDWRRGWLARHDATRRRARLPDQS